MSDRQDYIHIIAREVYNGQWKKNDVQGIVDDYSHKNTGFNKMYMAMSDRAMKMFDNAVWRRVEELGQQRI